MAENNSYALAELASYLQTKLYQAELCGDPNYRIQGLSTLAAAKPIELAFLANNRYQKYLADTDAGCVLLNSAMSTGFSGNKLVVDNPYLAFAYLTALFKTTAVNSKGYDGVACANFS